MPKRSFGRSWIFDPHPGDLSPWLRRLRELRDRYHPDYSAREPGFINPKDFLHRLSQQMPEDTIYVADVGQNQIWSANHVKMKMGRFLTSGGMGTMGYSVPAAVGAKLAAPQREVIAACGDGSFQMQMMELATICQDHVGIKILIFRNDKLGMVKEIQKKSYGERYIATSLEGNPDFVMLAQAYGIAARSIGSMEQMDEAIRWFLNVQGPCVLACAVDPEESSK